MDGDQAGRVNSRCSLISWTLSSGYQSMNKHDRGSGNGNESENVGTGKARGNVHRVVAVSFLTIYHVLPQVWDGQESVCYFISMHIPAKLCFCANWRRCSRRTLSCLARHRLASWLQWHKCLYLVGHYMPERHGHEHVRSYGLIHLLLTIFH